MVEHKETPDDELKLLQKELEELREFKSNTVSKSRIKGRISTLLVKMWIGPDLNEAFENWLNVRKLKNPKKSVTETANVMAAIVRRVIKVGIIGFALALLPAIVAIWQLWLMSKQNASIVQQIDEQRKATVTEQNSKYFDYLLLSDSEKQYWSAISFFATEEDYKNDAMRRLAYLVKIGHPDTKCKSLKALISLYDLQDIESRGPLRKYLIPRYEGAIFAELNDFECNNLRLSRADLSDIVFRNVTFKDLRLYDVDVSGLLVSGSDLSGADFELLKYCDDEGRCLSIRNSKMTKSDLYTSGVSFDTSQNGVEFQKVDLNHSLIDGFLLETLRANLEPDLPDQNFLEPAICFRIYEADSCLAILHGKKPILDVYKYCDIEEDFIISTPNYFSENSVCNSDPIRIE